MNAYKKRYPKLVTYIEDNRDFIESFLDRLIEHSQATGEDLLYIDNDFIRVRKDLESRDIHYKTVRGIYKILNRYSDDICYDYDNNISDEIKSKAKEISEEIAPYLDDVCSAYEWCDNCGRDYINYRKGSYNKELNMDLCNGCMFIASTPKAE